MKGGSLTNPTEYDIHLVHGTGNLATHIPYAPPIDTVTTIISFRF
jgi:hypothetical protein